MRIVMVFLDGFGLGPDDREVNPVLRARTPVFDEFLEGARLVRGLGPVITRRAVLVPTDATLGMAGLPQSATGQTTLLTGVNAARAVGRHVNAYPTPVLKELLAAHSLFRHLKDLGFTTTLANAFSKEYFDMVEAGMRQHTAITVAALAAGVRLRSLDDLAQGNAAYHDLTNELLRQRGHDVPVVEATRTGANLASLALAHDFCLFEHFLTDMIGHSQDMAAAVKLVERIDSFVGALLEGVSRADCLTVITSDHGNIEDLSVRTHTANPVPTIIVGQGAPELARQIAGLADIAPAVVDFLRGF